MNENSKGWLAAIGIVVVFFSLCGILGGLVLSSFSHLMTFFAGSLVAGIIMMLVAVVSLVCNNQADSTGANDEVQKKGV